MTIGGTDVAAPAPVSDVDVEPDDPKAARAQARSESKAKAAALADVLAPVKKRTLLAQFVQIFASAATVVPFIGIVELGRILLEPGPVDSGRV